MARIDDAQLFVHMAHLLGLEPEGGDSVDGRRVKRHLRQGSGAIRAFLYAGGRLSLFFPAGSDLAGLDTDLGLLSQALQSASGVDDPFFAAISEDTPRVEIRDTTDDDEEEDEDGLWSVECRLLIPEGEQGRDEHIKASAILKKKVETWKENVGFPFAVERAVSAVGGESEKEVLELPFAGELIRQESAHGEMYLGVASLSSVWNHHKALGQKYQLATNHLMVSTNIRAYLGAGTHTNHALLQSFKAMEAGADPADFPFLHNGMTLSGTSARKVTRDGRNVLAIGHPRIINGAQTLFAYDDYRRKAKKPIEPLVLVKVVREKSDDGFLRRVTMANNRQNPVFSFHLRAADDEQFRISQAFRELRIWYFYKEGTGKPRLVDVRMRKDLLPVLLALDLKLSVLRSPDKVFDEEDLYQRYFGILAERAKAGDLEPFRRIYCAMHLWRAMGRALVTLKIKQGRGEEVVPNEDHPLARVTFNGKGEDKLAFRKAAMSLVAPLLLRHYMCRYYEPKDFDACRTPTGGTFAETAIATVRKVAGESLKKLLVEKWLEDPAVRFERGYTDEDGVRQTRSAWSFPRTDEASAALLADLSKIDEDWKICKGDIWEILC